MSARLYTLKTNTQRQAEAHNKYSAMHMTPKETEKEMKGFSLFVRPIIFLAIMILIGILVWIPAKACGELEPNDTTIEDIKERTL